MKLVSFVVTCVALALVSCGCTTVHPTIVEVVGSGGAGGGGGTGGTGSGTGSGTETGGGGATSTSAETTTATSTATGQGGSAPTSGACLGYDEGQLSACRQPLDADACADLNWTYSPGATCPTANLVGCCYYALEYLCYYAPAFSPDIADHCEGEWQTP